MNSSSNRFKAKNKADGQDTILNALHDQAGDDAPFAASSAALQAANSVLLASMRARLGQAAPIPSPIHASAAKQATSSTAEHSPILAAAAEEAPAAGDAPNDTITTITETLPATAETVQYDTVSYEQLMRNLPEPVEQEAAPLTETPEISAAAISPAAQKRELDWRELEWDGETLAAPAPINFGRRNPEPEPEATAPVATESAHMPQAQLTERSIDAQNYHAENDSAYREWQSAMQPNERQWQKLAMIGVLVVAVAVNLAFFLSNGKDTPIKAIVASSTKLAPIDLNALTAAPGSKMVTIKVPTPSHANGTDDNQILFPDKNPPKLNDVDESYGTQKAAEPRALEVSSQLSLPNQEGPVPNRMPTTVIPSVDAEHSLNNATQAAPSQHLTPPKPAAHDAPLPVPSTKKQATINPQQLLRVLSRP